MARGAFANRFDGRIKSWNAERGFGFIEPSQGGDELFVHIDALPRSLRPPRPGQVLSFEVETDSRGRKRAVRLLPARRSTQRTARRAAPALSSAPSLFVLFGFAVLFAALAVLWRIPAVVALLYAFASVVCFLAYASDKAAARRGDWRASETTLIALGLVGGWPGAILAQQFLRHKTVKRSFRHAFWWSVGANVLAFVYLDSPWAPQWH